MRVDTFLYELPQDRVAQAPAAQREQARLLRVAQSSLSHHLVGDLPDLVPEGTLIVVNDTRVLRARLLGVKAETGGRVEIFLVRPEGTRQVEVCAGEVVAVCVWRAMGKASKALRFGTDVRVGTGPLALVVRLLGRSQEDGLLEVGLWLSERSDRRYSPQAVDEAIRAHGHVPLPPYIKREDEPNDAERYQTVYARVDGAVAAPTAGLHLSRALLGRLAVRGCWLASVTLHVGLGTFQPVTAEDLDNHPMHAERFHISRATADTIARARHEGRPLLAIGTTVVRALESAADPQRPGHVTPMEGETRLLIQPGYRFRVVDLLFTNFHLPRSTLLALVCAFGGTERVLGAYRVAVQQGYRFYSYGDAMLLARSEG